MLDRREKVCYDAGKLEGRRAAGKGAFPAGGRAVIRA